MDKQILIVYQYPDFIQKVLHELFPERFKTIDANNIPADLFVTAGQDSYHIFTQLGLNCTGYASIPEIYIENSLVKGELPSQYSHAYVVGKKDL